MVNKYIAKKHISDSKMETLSGKQVSNKHLTRLFDMDVDVYTDDGRIIARFRKGALNNAKAKDFYENVIDFAKINTYSRGELNGVKKGHRRDITNNKGVKTNILGYMDGFSPSQKIILKNNDLTTPLSIRETRFNIDYPEEWKKCIPFIKDINTLYKKLIPSHYQKQNKKAKSLTFKIPNTAFTTVTTNVNVTTKIHKDKGDDVEGFGNLAVIENGEYEGGETCLPQYGVGFNVRSGDILFMDVHEWHGNLPIKLKQPDAVRLSIVCYLRTNIWKEEQKYSKSDVKKHIKVLKQLTKKRKIGGKNKTMKK